MTVRRRKDGRWQIDVVIWKGGERVRVRKSAHAKNRSEALECERQERAALESGAQAVGKAPVFKDFVGEFMKTYVATNNKPSEAASKRTIFDVHLIPFFGSMPLDEIGLRDIERYKAKKIEKLALKTVNNHLTVLRKCLSVANEWGQLRSVPRVKWLRVPPSSFAFFGFEEATRLVSHAGDWRPMILLGLRTGLRQGELLALRWEDIDLTAGRLTVRHAVSRGVIGTPKNGRTREVPLSDEALAVLRGLSSRFRGDFVFCTPEGRMLTKGECKWPLWSACKRAGVQRAGWHVLRHSFASHLVMRGVPIKAAQELLGHADIGMTMRYAHLSPDVRRDAVQLLDGMDQVTIGTRSEVKR